MSQNLMISDSLYERLEAIAREYGLSNIEEFIEQLIDVWEARVDELRHRREAVQRIDTLREHIFAEYGSMSDSLI